MFLVLNLVIRVEVLVWIMFHGLLVLASSDVMSNCSIDLSDTDEAKVLKRSGEGISVLGGSGV